VEAVGLLREQGLDVHLTLAGDGPERDALGARIERAGLGDRVTMPGFVSDVMGLLDESDILVNPSDTECMPNSVLEAMSAGTAIVATDVGGVGEMIRDGREGLLVAPGDPAALAGAIGRMIEHRRRREDLAARARLRVEERFSFASRMEAMVALYRRVLRACGSL
jgi:glycosyltransferase involved in cell wall biosynthesis